MKIIYPLWYDQWSHVPKGFTMFRQQVIPLRAIRGYMDREYRIYFLWCRLVYVTYRVRKLRRTIAHGFAYLSRWKDLKWGNTKLPAARRGGANAQLGGATTVVGDTNNDLEAADPELNPVDVIDAAGDKAAGKLVQAWCTLTSLCLSTIAAQFLPAMYFIVMMAWGIAKAFLKYVIHVLVVSLLETTYVRRLVLTLFATVFLRVAYWMGMIPMQLEDLSRPLLAFVGSPLRLS